MSVRQHLYEKKGRIRICTTDKRIRIREAQKHADPANPDPQHSCQPRPKLCSLADLSVQLKSCGLLAGWPASLAQVSAGFHLKHTTQSHPVLSASASFTWKTHNTVTSRVIGIGIVLLPIRIRLSILMPIQIRVRIRIQIRILPHVMAKLENQKCFVFYWCSGSGSFNHHAKIVWHLIFEKWCKFTFKK